MIKAWVLLDSLGALLGRVFRLGRPSTMLACIAAAGLVAGCAGTRGGPIPYGVDDFGAPDRQQAATLEQDYQIAPLDTLAVTVYPAKELDREVQVDLRGMINMPLIGEVKAIDLTTTQLQDEIARQLDAKYLQAPQVVVAVKASTRSSVTLDGSVVQPGIYPVTGQMTLLQAIAQGRGVNRSANPKRVAIFRQIDGQRMAAAFDLTTIRTGSDPDPRIYGGDIVVVDGSELREAQRELLMAVPLLRFLTY